MNVVNEIAALILWLLVGLFVIHAISKGEGLKGGIDWALAKFTAKPA